MSAGPIKMRSPWKAIAGRLQAIEQGFFNAEIVPVAVPGRKGETIVVARRRSAGRIRRSKRSPSCGRRLAADGTVTAGNASQISDGAAAVVVGDERTAARACTRRSKARIVATATSGVAPKEIFIAPVTAIENVLDKAKLKLADIDLVELNEAFAAQCLACMRPLGLDPAKTNVSGGAIALGHPIGASGARVLVTLLHALAAPRPQARPGRPLPRRRQRRGDDRRADVGQATA